MQALAVIVQTLLLIAIAPLISGIIRKIKNNLRMRKGPGVLQPYYNLAKLFAKDEVVSENSSWIFTAAPYIVFGAFTCALLFVPMGDMQNPFNYIGDLL